MAEDKLEQRSSKHRHKDSAALASSSQKKKIGAELEVGAIVLLLASN